MSLDIDLICSNGEIKNFNITHNLTKMADAAGLYYALCRPYKFAVPGADDCHEDLITVKAKELIETLEIGLNNLVNSPSKFKAYNPENGWGSYSGLVKFVIEYLEACRLNPDATIEVDR